MSNDVGVGPVVNAFDCCLEGTGFTPGPVMAVSIGADLLTESLPY